MKNVSIGNPWGLRSSSFLVALTAMILVNSLILSANGRHHRPLLIEFAESAFFLEENDTDGDLGVHFKVDGDPWDRVVLFAPNWRKLVDIQVKGNSREIGLTELFNESAEPSFDELPRDEFLELFPEGEYRFYGRTIDGDWLGGLAELTHIMPDPPEIVSPEEDEEVDPEEPLVVEWEEALDPDGSEIVNIIVVVEKDEDEERVRVVSADMAPGDTSFTLSPGFLEPGKEYKIEILFEEASGNKIITESPFETEGGDEEEE